jgi:hypothetical protein
MKFLYAELTDQQDKELLHPLIYGAPRRQQLI